MILAVALSCKADLKTGPNYGPVTIEPVQGNGQSATVGTAVAIPPSLLIKNDLDLPVANVVVTFNVATGGGSIIGNTVTTGADGIATLAGWTLGTTAGTNTVSAVATGLEQYPVVLTATGVPDSPAQLIESTPVPDTAQDAVPFTPQPGIQVIDQYGNVVTGSGASVTATLVAGNGTLQGTATIPTSANGVAGFTDLSILGPVGTYTLAFNGPSLPTISADLNLVAGEPTSLVLLTPPPGTARSGVPLTPQPVLQLRDRSDNPVPLDAVVVTATIASGGGVLTGTAISTDGAGIARFTNLAITGTTGTRVLQFSAIARVTPLASGPVNVTAGTAALLSKTAGDNQVTAVGTAVPINPVVTVTDVSGNPVAGSLVTFTVTSGNGNVANASATTDGQGQASSGAWTLGPVAGPNTLSAVVSGIQGSPAVFTATGSTVIGPPAQLLIVSGDGQTGVAGSALAESLVVRLVDAGGNGVPGVPVAWTVLTGGGSLGPAAAVTDGNGRLAARWTLGGTAGSNTARAQAAGFQAGFAATGLAGQATQLSLFAAPTTAQSGIPFTTQPAVALLDGNGNPVAQANVTVTAAIASGGGLLGGTLTATTNGFGRATFANLSLTGLVGSRVLRFSATNVAPVNSGNIQLTAGSAATLSKVAGDGQTAVVGTPVATNPSVQVTDGAGNPVANVTVGFAVTSGGGSIASGNSPTNAQGMASGGAWTLGPALGGNSLTVTSAGLTGSPAVFTATGVAAPGQPTALLIVSGNGQSGAAGTALAESLVVRVIDGNGVGVPGVGVQWAIGLGGGSVSPSSVTSDGNGRAAVRWTVGPSVGLNQVTATAAGFNATFSATAVAGPAFRLVLAAQPFTARSGFLFSPQPAISLEDSHGNPVTQSGVVVTAAIGSGGGALGGTLTATTSAGTATFTNLMITGVVGARTLTFTSPSLQPVTSSPFPLTAGSATNLSKNAGDNQSAPVATALPVDVEVLVTDASGNPVPAVTVTFTVLTGGGNVAAPTGVTNAQGVASPGDWTLGPVAGSNTLLATSAGLNGSPLTFTATGTAGPPASMVKVSGDGQSGLVAAVLPESLVVRVLDGNGVGVPGVTVQWAIGIGGGSVSPSSVTSDNNGRAAVAWTLGTAAGPNQVTATGAGLTATYTATGVAGAAFRLALGAQPSTAQSGLLLSPQPAIGLLDSHGNPVVQTGVVVTAAIASGGGALGGTLTATTSAGTATFTDLKITGLVGPRTLTFTSPGLLPVTSSPFPLTAGSAVTLAKVAGDGQTAVVGTPVATDPSVRVTDGAGNPVANVVVGFAVTSGGGSIASGSANTNAQGMASGGAWTLGPALGSNGLTVTSAGLNGSPAVFTATGVATSGQPTDVLIVSGDGQSGTVASALAESLVVRVVDGNGVGVSGVVVQWTIGTGGGTVSPVSVTSDGTGLAAVEWALGAAPGPNQATATAGSLSATFSATAVVNAAFRLVLATQPSTAQSGLAFNPQPVISLADSLGNPVPQSGVVVTAAIGSGGGTLGGTLTATTSAGTATFTDLKITGLVGARTLTFTSPGLQPVTSSPFPLTAGSATNLSKKAGDNQSAPVGTALPVDVEVNVTDASGNPVPGVTVNFTVLTGGGNVAAPSGVSNAQGVATPGDWTLGSAAGSNTLRAASTGLTGSPLTFTATGTAGPPATTAIISGNGQSGLIGTVLAESLVVRVADGQGNPISGAQVSWSVLTGGGLVSPALDATDGAGLAATAWTVGLLAGPATVRAQLGGLTAVFSATILPASQAMHPVFSTYLGGSQEDQVRDIAVDALGNIFVTGGTVSPDFPTTGGVYDRSHNGNYDVYVAKLDPQGNLVWSTFIGGPNYDRAYAVELDAQGFVYVAGRAGDLFPVTAGAFQTTFQGSPDVLPYGPQDGFLCKLRPNGSAIVWCSYFGTDDNKMIRDIDLDAQGNIYLASSSDGGTFPNGWFANPYQRNRAGGIDGVVGKVSNDGSQVLWLTYIGGSQEEAEEPSIQVDNAGNVFALYSTESVDAPAPNGFDQSLDGARDLYLVKFSNDGSQLLFGTYLGGHAGEDVETHELALDPQGNPVVASSTDSRDYPVTPGAYQDSMGGVADGVITRVSANGSQILNSTYLGGRFKDNVEGISMDAAGNVYVTGSTETPGLSFLAGGFQPDLNGVLNDMIFVKLSPDLSTVLYGTYLGGSDDDLGRAGIVTLGGDYIFGGNILSTNFPTIHPLQGGSGGGLEGAVAKFSPGP